MKNNALKRQLYPYCHYVNISPIMIALACDEARYAEVRQILTHEPYKTWADHGVRFAEFYRLANPARRARKDKTGMKCERCEKEGAQLHSLTIEVDNGESTIREPVRFTLCDHCYDYGCDLEPIQSVGDFLTLDTPEPWGPAS